MSNSHQEDFSNESAYNQDQNSYNINMKDICKTIYKYSSQNPNSPLNQEGPSDVKSLESLSGRDYPRPFNNEADNMYTCLNEENKMRMQLMEKDRIIFEYSKTLKETERVLDNTKKLNLAKEEVITKLKDEIRDLKFKIKNVDNLIRHKDDEFEKFKTHTEERIIFANKEKVMVEEKLFELTKLFETSQNDFQNTLIEYKKIEKQLVKLKSNFSEKNEHVVNLEKLIENLKKENKIIPTFKKQTQDLENQINELKTEIRNEQTSTQKFQHEKDIYERKLKELSDENKANKELANKSISLSYELESSRKDLDEKQKEINNLTEKYRSLSKENDNFFYVINNEVSNFTTMVEELPACQGTIKLNTLNSYPGIRNNYHTNNQFSLKYELINKNFEILRNKIVENYNNSITDLTKLGKLNEEVDKFNQEIQLEKSNLIKEFTLTKQKLEETNEYKEELEKSFDKVSDDLKSLKQSHAKLKTEHEDALRKNESICNEIELFLNDINTKLKEKFPEITNEASKISQNIAEGNLNFAEKILYYIDILCTDYNRLIISEKELMENMKMNQIQLKNSDEEKDLFKARIERILINKEEELSQADRLKNDELKRQREVLYEKITSLTNLLEETNSMIVVYENENRELKEKLNKCEFNLKMLTNSHLELESSIAGNLSNIHLENEEKENKFNHLLRDIEFKNIHIESIENMLRRKDEEIEKLISDNVRLRGNDEQFRSTFGSKNNIADELNNDTNPTSRFNNNFSPNENNERELRNLITSYNSDKPVESVSTVPKKRVPGKIYSFKKA